MNVVPHHSTLFPKKAIRFLHDGGSLLHYDDRRLKLNELYFLDLEWLCHMMSQVVTIPQISPFIKRNGVSVPPVIDLI